MARGGPIRTFAPAKVNLFLHVGPVDAAGYHPIRSLGVFADVGDWLTVARSDALALTVEGPFAGEVGDTADNLVLRALRRLGDRAGIGEPPLSAVLDKQLPVASGLGGGSSDAGAALRAARQALGLDMDDAALEAVALEIGADGPLCLWHEPRLIKGRGERLSPGPSMPPLPAVLVNPRVPSSTAAVYRAYDSGEVRGVGGEATPDGFGDIPSTIDWLASMRNDLEAPAVALEPRILPALEAVGAAGARLTRLSGSGATAFGLFTSRSAADRAARDLARAHPLWWVRSVWLH